MSHTAARPIPFCRQSAFIGLAIACAVFATAARAAPTRTEVNEFTDYLRIENLSDSTDALEAALDSPVLIVDLRYVSGNETESPKLGQLLARKPIALEHGGRKISIGENTNRPESQLTLVLVNGETRGDLEAVLSALQSAGDIVLVGSPTAGDSSLSDEPVAPALRIEANAEIEKAAFLAFGNGTSLSDLLDAPVEKKRFDEALLLSEFDGASEGHPNESAAASSEDSPKEKSDDDHEEPALVDRTLQRAVNTVIALKALGKI